MLNEVKHPAIAREILRCAQNDTIHHLRCDKALVRLGRIEAEKKCIYCGSENNLHKEHIVPKSLRIRD